MKPRMFVSILVLVLVVLISTGSCATQKQNMEATPMGTMDAHDSIDLRGKTITTYILYFTVEKLQHMHQGEVLEVITDNYEAIHTDMQAWTRMTGHILKSTEKKEHYYIFYIEKSSRTEVDLQLAMVISSKGLTELLSPLGFALGAALEGIDVHLYFQGPGVKVLKQGYQAKLPGLGRPFSGAARKGMAEVGHIPPQEKLQQLHELGAHIYICAGSMDHYKVKKEELIFDDIIVAEYLTFMEVMASADIQFYM